MASKRKITHCKFCYEQFLQRRTNQLFCNRICKGAFAFLKKRKKILAIKKNQCDFCGFIATDSCQLDIDHIDGNHKNNSENNLQTLCANCHRLKTKLKGDWKVIRNRNKQHIKYPIN